MSAHQASFPITTMARGLGVSTAGYYAWLKRVPSTRAEDDAKLLQCIRTVHATSRATYYLAIVLDAWSRKIVGWSMANHLRTELVLDALDAAVAQRRPRDVIHHSDQGSQPGFNWSSQRLCGAIANARQTPRRVSSSRGSCAACC
jgi:transposase InsO family protein